MSSLDVRRISQRARIVLDGFTLGQKAVVAVGIAGLVGAALLLGSWSSAPSYSPLFTNLASSDASAIIDQLTTQHEPYKLADGGQTILVPPADVYKMRLALASKNLPSGGQTGYALLDKQGVTTSDFIQHVDYQRALEGELARTIQSIDGVQAALVHLVVPTQDVFAADTTQPSASVLVRTAGGATLSSEQVQAIVHLVSSSVESLKPDAVTVADGAGHVLSAPGVATGAAADARAEQTNAFDTRLQTSLQDLLATVVGAGHAVVRVSADLNLDQATSTAQSYVPVGGPNASQVPLTSSTSTETYSGNGSVPSSGVLGPDNTGATVQTGTGNAATSGATKYSKTVTNSQNALGTLTTQSTSTPGAVKRLSVAVLLDQSALKGTTPAAVQQLVSQAAGLQPTRGDTIAVTALPFDATATAQDTKTVPKAASSGGGIMSLLQTGALLAALILVIATAMRGARRVERTPLMLPAERLELEAARRALAGGELRQLGTATVALPSPRAAIEDQDPTVSAELEGLVDRQPEEVAALLRGWLAEKW